MIILTITIIERILFIINISTCFRTHIKNRSKITSSGKIESTIVFFLICVQENISLESKDRRCDDLVKRWHHKTILIIINLLSLWLLSSDFIFLFFARIERDKIEMMIHTSIWLLWIINWTSTSVVAIYLLLLPFLGIRNDT